jgi:hypothetical protein
MDYRMLECDHCQKTCKLEASSGWVNVRVIVGSAEELARLQARGENALDSGDFCSLTCLSAWASLQATSHELDDFVEGSGEGQPA